MANYIVNGLLLLFFGGSAIWYGLNYTPVMGKCLKYDLTRSNIVNRGLFAYDLVQNGQVVQYQNWGGRYGCGLKVGNEYKLLVSKKDPNKINGYNMFVIHGVLGVLTMLDLIFCLIFSL